MVGHIYILLNNTNDLVYIGQTVQDVRERFSQHKYLAKSGKFKTKLYKAMNDIGIDKFYCIELDCIEASGNNLTLLESYYIDKYNAILNGYNTVMPTSPISYHSLFEYYGDSIVDAYISGKTYNDIADQFRISRNSVAKIVSGLGVINQHSIQYRSIPYKTVMYDTQFSPIGKFDSIKDAIRWLNANTRFKPDLRNGYNYIKGATSRGNIAYGHRWQLLDDLIYNDMVFRTRFDIINYINGEPFIKRNGYIICGDISSLIKVGGYRQFKNSGIEKILKEDESNKVKSQSEIEKEQVKIKLKELREQPGILFELLKHYNYSELGRMYSCSPNYIKKIALSHGYSLSSVRLEAYKQ